MVISTILAAVVVGAAAWADPSEVAEKLGWGPLAPYPKEMRFYPAQAQKDQRDGLAYVQCQFGDGRALRDCVVLAEGPLGYGFGEAALTLVALFRLKEGAPPPSRRFVRIPIMLRMAGPKATFTAVDLISDTRCYLLQSVEADVGSPTAGPVANNFGDRVTRALAELHFKQAERAEWLASMKEGIPSDPNLRAPLRAECSARANSLKSARQ